MAPTLKDGYLYKCNFCAWVPFFFNYFNIPYPKDYDEKANRINLYSNSIEILDKFMQEPVGFCKYCTQYYQDN